MTTGLTAQTSSMSLENLVDELAKNIGLNVLTSSAPDLMRKAINHKKVTRLVNDPLFQSLRTAYNLNNIRLERGFVDIEPSIVDAKAFPELADELQMLSTEDAEDEVAERLMKCSFFVIVSTESNNALSVSDIASIECHINKVLGLEGSTSSVLKLSKSAYAPESITSEPLAPFSQEKPSEGSVWVLEAILLELDWSNPPCLASLSHNEKSHPDLGPISIHGLEDNIWTTKALALKLQREREALSGGTKGPLSYCRDAMHFFDSSLNVVNIDLVGANSLLTDEEVSLEVEQILEAFNS